MILALIGLLLVAASVGVVVDVVVENAGHLITVLLAQRRFMNRPVAGVFVAGALTGLLFVLGLALVFTGMARRRMRRRQRAEPERL